MAKLQEVLDLIQVQEDIKIDADAEIKRLKLRILDKFSDVRVGSVVKVTGYSHTGRDMVVQRIAVQTYKTQVSVLTTGKILKKDGGVGLLEGRHLFDIKGVQNAEPA